MADSEFIIKDERLQYSGLFNVAELHKHIDEYFEEKGYDKGEIKNAEIVNDSGERFIEVIFRPWKKITDYAKVSFDLRLTIEDMKDVEINKNGIKIIVQHGNIHIEFDVIVTTDYEERWSDTKTLVFWRILFDRFFLKEYTKQYYAEGMDDFKMLKYQIQSFLNMFKE
jgi:hypothetical protein